MKTSRAKAGTGNGLGRASAQSGSPIPRSSYHHGDLRRALIEAAARLIDDGETGQPTLKAVAEATGTSVAAPYRHFPDRESLLAAVLTEAFIELAFDCEQARARAHDPEAALRACALAYLRFARRRPGVYRLMFGPACDKARHMELAQAGQNALGVLKRAVTDCVAIGLFAHATGDAQALVVSGWALTHGLATLHLDGMLPSVATRAALEQQLQQAIDLLLRKDPA